MFILLRRSFFVDFLPTGKLLIDSFLFTELEYMRHTP